MLTFKDARSWLNRSEDSRLSKPIKRLVEHMRQAWNERLVADTIGYVELLQQVEDSLSDISDNFERAEIHLECGQIYYEMGDYSRAVMEFQRAVSLYRAGNPHNFSVANWLLGCAFWRRSRQSDAISRWERARRGFGEIAKRIPDSDSDWYKERIKEMSNTLNRAIDEGHWPFDT